jgi:hypothetical protein
MTDHSLESPSRVAFPRGICVKIVGLGGVGNIVARYAAMFLASAAQDGAKLVLIDGDGFEEGNASRMFFRSVGNKAAVLLAELRDYLADSNLTLLAVEDYVTPENIARLIQEGDVVILAVDNHRTRKLVSDFIATQRSDACLISAGNDPSGPDSTGTIRRGTYGNCQVYIRKASRDLTYPLTIWHPEIDDPADQLPGDTSCIEAVRSTPQILFANLMAACSALCALHRYLAVGTNFDEVAFDIADAVMRPVPFAPLSAVSGRTTPPCPRCAPE